MTHGRRRRVLVVDDEQHIVDVLSRILESEYDLESFTSPTEAVARLMAGERYDAILCDMMMPGLTGMDLHHELVKHWPEQAERMMFITGGAMRADQQEFLLSTHIPVLVKPFSVDSVLDLVRSVVGRG